MTESEQSGGVTIGNIQGGIINSIIAGGDVIVGSTEGKTSPAPGPSVEDMHDNWDVAAIRQLLVHAFTPQSLGRFCHDRPQFRPIIDDIAPNSGLNGMVECVIVYCETHLLFNGLLDDIKEENPQQYARFEPYRLRGA